MGSMWTVPVKVSVGWREGWEGWCAERISCIVMGVGEMGVVVVVVVSRWRRCGCCALYLNEMRILLMEIPEGLMREIQGCVVRSFISSRREMDNIRTTLLGRSESPRTWKIWRLLDAFLEREGLI
jgi:hypothetical protein